MPRIDILLESLLMLASIVTAGKTLAEIEKRRAGMSTGQAYDFMKEIAVWHTMF
jgi:hypothetical protein